MSPSMMSNWSTNAMPASTFVASSTATSYTPTYSWAHTVPTYMPWTTTIPTPVMQFTAPFPPDPCTSQTATSWELLHNLGASQNRIGSHQHLKRKNCNLEDFKSPKQYISEEKMLARLNELHISNNPTTPHKETNPIEGYENRGHVKSLEELELMLSDESDEESDAEVGGITLSPELKKLVKSDSFLPESLLKEIKEPSMALVLWQPPIGVLPEALKHPFPSDEQKRDDLKANSYSENNNNDGIMDRNCSFTTRNDRSLFIPEEKLDIQLFDGNEDNDMDL